jgi:cation diffusion facilitator family transporter
MINEKQRIAFNSALVLIFLTGSEFFAGIATGSLGMLSLALFSGLNLIAAISTFLLVRISNKPPDKKHNFGHGKIENLSVLIKTTLLFIICSWIIFAALHFLKTPNTGMEFPSWSYIVVIASIIVDFFRARTLRRAFKVYDSQTLEADALHFSTDIWSSSLVLLGLIFTSFGFFFADSVAVIIVAFMVIIVNYQLFKRSSGVLLDFSPVERLLLIENILNSSHEIKAYHSLKVRTAGAYTFVNVVISLKPQIILYQANEICNKIEKEICKVVNQCDVFVQVEASNQKGIVL